MHLVALILLPRSVPDPLPGRGARLALRVAWRYRRTERNLDTTAKRRGYGMIDSLRVAPLLSGLTDDQLRQIAAGAVRQRIEEGQWLFSQGDLARRFHLVQKGQIRLFRLSPEGAEKVIEIVSAGQTTFAEALIFLSTPRYPVCAAALETCEVIVIDSADFAKMLRESVDTCFTVMGALSMRFRALIDEIDNLTLYSAKSRVARWLLAHCPEDRRAFELDVRKGVLASRLSVKPETFSRVIKQLTTDGVLSVHGAHVTILARDTLIDMAKLADSEELGSAETGVWRRPACGLRPRLGTETRVGDGNRGLASDCA